MDYRGLTVKYKVNRPLTTKEDDFHMLQNEPSRSKPLYQEQIIRMNSTYLECVDRFFMVKGFMLAVMIFATGVSIWFIYFGLLIASEDQLYVGGSVIFFFGSIMLFINIKFFLLKECFTYTHFPIRFNRKTRKVHVFRRNGTVMTEDWEKLYFTLCPCQEDEWEVRGNRMDKDGITVLETFALPFADSLNRNRSTSKTWSFWEFVRRYMEEPDELPALADQVESVIDIADKREGFGNGFGRLFGVLGMLGVLLIFIWGPICFVYAIGRAIAMYTSKIPKWPAEIEAECKIEPDDPYLRDGEHLAQPPEPEKTENQEGGSWSPYGNE